MAASDRRFSSASTRKATTSGTRPPGASQTFENIYALERLHDFFARLGVRPTYLVTYPVARDARSADVLRRLAGRGDCEIGAHHHAWETPPCDPADVDRHPYALSLPLTQFDEQLASLTTAIDEARWRAARSRTDPAGSGSRRRTCRRSNGRATSWSRAWRRCSTKRTRRGPDFVDAPLAPYFLSYDDATRPGSSALLELPISAALNRRVPAWLERRYGRLPWPYTTKRLMRLARLAHVRWLRPSYSSADDMIALARQLTARGVPLLNVIFHSSEAIVGGSPYNRTEAELSGFFDRLERFLDAATQGAGRRSDDVQ